MTTPQYTHTCPLCRFRGTVNVHGKRIEVYLCCGGKSLLLRYSSRKGDYYAAPLDHFPLQSQEDGQRVGNWGNRIAVGPINRLWEAAGKEGWI